MLNALTVMVLLAEAPSQTTLPRHPDPDPVEQKATREGTPTDPWFDRAHAATDDAAFILSAVESSRQGMMDARSAAGMLQKPELRAAAASIEKQNEATSRKLEELASTKGWRLPEGNPGRVGSFEAAMPARTHANFIISQISYHEATLAQYRAQLSGNGDPALKRTLRGALPGFEKNLDLLLTLKP
jgi:hypothetical protein